MKLQLKTMVLVLALAPAAVNSAAVYQWTDADGVTHFGDRQPTDTQAERINVRSDQPSSANTRPSAQQQVNELEQRQQAASEALQAVNAEATRNAQRRSTCDAAQQSLKILNNNVRIRTNEGGEQRFLTPDEVLQQKQTSKNIVEQNCDVKKTP